jgi:hypothetical protein
VPSRVRHSYHPNSSSLPFQKIQNYGRNLRWKRMTFKKQPSASLLHPFPYLYFPTSFLVLDEKL